MNQKVGFTFASLTGDAGSEDGVGVNVADE